MNTSTVEKVMDGIHNWFSRGCVYGTYEVQEGAIDCPDLAPGQFYRIVGSTFNDGLHKEDVHDLAPETFTGKIYLLAVPKGFLDLCDEIEAWEENNAKVLDGPFKSESFGGYSYTIAQDSSGSPAGWSTHFSKALNRWRKLP